jgi:hypothetical protein
MDFYAIYPAGNENVEFDYDKKQITYSMPPEASDQKDILLATNESMTESKSSNNGTVELSFDHICSRLSFRLDESFELEGSEGNNTVIEEITIDGIYREGVYDISTQTWSVSGDKSIRVENLAQPTIIGGESYTDNLLTDEKSLIIIPQNLTNIKLTVKIGEYKESNGKYQISNAGTWECELTTSETLEAGKSYYITISKGSGLTDSKYSDKGEIEYTDYDSYYYFEDYTFTLKEGTKSWAIVADVDWITFSKTESKYQKYGFWVDKEAGSAIVRGINDGTKKEVTVWAYCKENLSTSDRQAKIMLIENGELTDCKFMRQKGLKDGGKYYTAQYEYENNNGETTVSCWGFYNDWATVTFESSTVDFESLTKEELNNYISIVSNNGTQKLTINFSKLCDTVTTIGISTNDNNGIGNTKQDFLKNGFWHMLQMALAFKDREGVTMDGSLDKVIDCAIVRAVQFNKFTMINKYGTQVPDINDADIKWYLPARSETTETNVRKGSIIGGGQIYYWTSSGYKLVLRSAFRYANNEILSGSYAYSERNTTDHHIVGARTKAE